MKKFFGYAAVSAMLLVPLVSFAAEFRAGDQPSVRTDERIANDLYIAGGSVTSAGDVTGDLVAGGGNIIISGAVGVDLIAGGGNVTILSNIGDDVRVGGGNIVIQGKVGGDVIAGGGQITLGGPGVGGDVAIGGGNIRIDAPIAGNAHIGGGSVYINAPITGDIQIEANQVTLGSKAVITGTMHYKANKELTKEDGAVINGTVTFEQRPQNTVPIAAIISFWIIGKFLVLLVCALIIGLVFKRFSKTAITKAVEHPWAELGRGLVVFAALPILSVLACVTVVGIPFGALGLLSFMAILLLAWIVTPIIVGSVVYRYFSKRDWEVSWKTILLGVFLYSVVGIVPFVGWLAQALIMLLSIGVVAAIKWDAVRQWK